MSWDPIFCVVNHNYSHYNWASAADTRNARNVLGCWSAPVFPTKVVGVSCNGSILLRDSWQHVCAGFVTLPNLGSMENTEREILQLSKLIHRRKCGLCYIWKHNESCYIWWLIVRHRVNCSELSATTVKKNLQRTLQRLPQSFFCTFRGIFGSLRVVFVCFRLFSGSFRTVSGWA